MDTARRWISFWTRIDYQVKLIKLCKTFFGSIHLKPQNSTLKCYKSEKLFVNRRGEGVIKRTSPWLKPIEVQCKSGLFWGVNPSELGGGIYRREGKKLNKGGLRDGKSSTKIVWAFFGNIGKFLRKNAIKHIFGVVLVDILRKFRKNTHVWRKILLRTASNLEIHLPMCRDPLPPNISDENYTY